MTTPTTKTAAPSTTLAALMASGSVGTMAHRAEQTAETGTTEGPTTKTGGGTKNCKISAFGDLSGDVAQHGDLSGDITSGKRGGGYVAACMISSGDMALGDIGRGDIWARVQLGDQFGDIGDSRGD